LDTSTLCSSSNKSSRSSRQKSGKPKKRPGIVWNTVPNTDVIVTSKSGDVKVDDPNIILYKILPNEYVLKSFLPVYPKDALNRRTPTRAITNESRLLTISNTYLILIPIVIEDENESKQLVPKYFSREDLSYINFLLLKIAIEESEEKAKAIENDGQ